MNPRPDPVPDLLRDWAQSEDEDPPTPLTGVMLRTKHLLAQADRARAQARRLQAALVLVPLALMGVLTLPHVSPERTLAFLLALTPSTALSLVGTLGLATYALATWVTE